MISTNVMQSKHFDLHQVTEGIFAAIHKEGGAAYSNAGIIDLGDSTLVIDAFDTALAARDLRRISEELFSRPVDTLALTHSHNDHWIGASVFDENTTMFASEIVYEETRKWGQALLEDIKNHAEWDEYVKGLEEQLQSTADGRVRKSVESSITRVRYFMEEMSEFKPRYADQTFKQSYSFRGSKRRVDLNSFGAGHSSDDIVVQIAEEGVAFIGDIGFFNLQPYMGVCNLEHWREQLNELHESNFHTFVPGHGTLGGKEEINTQLRYFDVMEELIDQVVQKGGSIVEAMQISLPEPFAGWLMGSMGRFEVNVRYLYKRLGGELSGEVWET